MVGRRTKKPIFVRFFTTQRKAEMFLKKNRKNIKITGFRPTIQGNSLVFIRRRRKR